MAEKDKSLLEMTSKEIDELRQNDPAAYKAKADELDAKPHTPVSQQTRVVFRNGEPVEISEFVKYVNGVKQ